MTSYSSAPASASAPFTDHATKSMGLVAVPASSSFSLSSDVNSKPLLHPPTPIDNNTISAKSQRIIYSVLVFLALVSMIFLIVSTTTPEIFSEPTYLYNPNYHTPIEVSTHFGYWRKCYLGNGYNLENAITCQDYVGQPSHDSYLPTVQAFAVLSDIFAGGLLLSLIMLPCMKSLHGTKGLWLMFVMSVLTISCTVICLAVFISKTAHSYHGPVWEYGVILSILAGSGQIIISIITAKLAWKKAGLSMDESAHLPF